MEKRSSDDVEKIKEIVEKEVEDNFLVNIIGTQEMSLDMGLARHLHHVWPVLKSTAFGIHSKDYATWKTWQSSDLFMLQHCAVCTVWKFEDISATQILREIQSDNVGISKTAIFTIFATQNLEVLGILNTFLKSQNVGPPKWPKLPFLISRNIWMAGNFFAVLTHYVEMVEILEFSANQILREINFNLQKCS